MKKILLFAAVISAFSFASCKKDHTCTCVTTGNYPGATSSTDVTTYTKSKKADARANCLSTSTVYMGYTTTQTCTLK
jgi:hypothetical protein